MSCSCSSGPSSGPYSYFNCSKFDLNCNDSYTVLLHAILLLIKNAQGTVQFSGSSMLQGVTADQITDITASLCDEAWTTDKTDAVILAALKRGLIVRVIDRRHYAVNGAMSRINPSNAPYYCICTLYN